MIAAVEITILSFFPSFFLSWGEREVRPSVQTSVVRVSSLKGKSRQFRVRFPDPSCHQLVGTGRRIKPWQKCFVGSGTRIKSMKNIFENRVRIFICKKVEFFQNLISRLNF
jgi:hypothetical protein